MSLAWAQLNIIIFSLVICWRRFLHHKSINKNPMEKNPKHW